MSESNEDDKNKAKAKKRKVATQEPDYLASAMLLIFAGIAFTLASVSVTNAWASLGLGALAIIAFSGSVYYTIISNRRN